VTASVAAGPQPQTPNPTPAAKPRSGCLGVLTSTLVLMLMCGGLFYGALKLDDYLASRDELADKPGVPVPSPTTSPTPDAIGGYVFNGIDGLREVLENRVIRTAGVPIPVESSCDTEDLAPEFTCTVSYQKEIVTYQVTVEPATGWREWEATTDSVVSTRAGIFAAVWRTHGGEYGTNVRCDKGIPEIIRVKPGTELSQRCYFTPTRKHPQFGDDKHLTTKVVSIVIGDGFIGVGADEAE